MASRRTDDDLVTVEVTYSPTLTDVGTKKQMPWGEARVLASEGRVKVVDDVVDEPGGEQPDPASPADKASGDAKRPAGKPAGRAQS